MHSMRRFLTPLMVLLLAVLQAASATPPSAAFAISKGTAAVFVAAAVASPRRGRGRRRPILSMLSLRGGGGGGEPPPHNHHQDEKKTLDSSSSSSSLSSLPKYEAIPSYDLPETWSSSATTTAQSSPLSRRRRRPTTRRRRRALIFMDMFSPYHGMYMSRMARDAWDVAVVNVLSDYMRGYFYKTAPHDDDDDDDDDVTPHQTMRLPVNQEEWKEWLAKIPAGEEPLEIVGILCESDSGLPEAERFGVWMNLEKHNGFNEARRDKFLMNEVVRNKAGLATVNQRLCRTVEEAVRFAREELGVPDKEEVPPSEALETDALALSKTENKDEKETSQSSNHCGVLGLGINTPTISSSSSPMCIVKPVRGVASESVSLCRNTTSVKQAFELVHGSTIFGAPSDKHDTVLVQEFAAGTEYAVDIVSRGGEHKVAAVWRYDKRPANGAPFVYYATELVDGNVPEVRAVCDYTKRALDALDVQWGMTHTEVIINKESGPRLVEVNCRHHNMDFAPLAMACLGYNALDMVLAAYLGGEEEDDDKKTPDTDRRLRLDWDKVPDEPVTAAHGAMVHLVNSATGKLVGLNFEALEEIQGMESVLAMEIYPSFLEIGSDITPTIDIRSDAGWVQMVHDDKEVFQREYERIVELMPTLFLVE